MSTEIPWFPCLMNAPIHASRRDAWARELMATGSDLDRISFVWVGDSVMIRYRGEGTVELFDCQVRRRAFIDEDDVTLGEQAVEYAGTDTLLDG